LGVEGNELEHSNAAGEQCSSKFPEERGIKRWEKVPLKNTTKLTPGKIMS